MAWVPAAAARRLQAPVFQLIITTVLPGLCATIAEVTLFRFMLASMRRPASSVGRQTRARPLEM